MITRLSKFFFLKGSAVILLPNLYRQIFSSLKISLAVIDNPKNLDKTKRLYPNTFNPTTLLEIAPPIDIIICKSFSKSTQSTAVYTSSKVNFHNLELFLNKFNKLIIFQFYNSFQLHPYLLCYQLKWHQLYLLFSNLETNCNCASPFPANQNSYYPELRAKFDITSKKPKQLRVFRFFIFYYIFNILCLSVTDWSFLCNKIIVISYLISFKHVCNLDKTLVFYSGAHQR